MNHQLPHIVVRCPHHLQKEPPPIYIHKMSKDLYRSPPPIQNFWRDKRGVKGAKGSEGVKGEQREQGGAKGARGSKGSEGQRE